MHYFSIPGETGSGEDLRYDGGAFANADSLWIEFFPPTSGHGPGHMHCPSPVSNSRITKVPGTDASGNFSFSFKGGGVSWTGSGGATSLEGYIKLSFFKHDEFGPYSVAVNCIDTNTYTFAAGCPDSPHIYGVVASCDLNGDGSIDTSDQSAFATYMGNTVTLQAWWQADYNHSGIGTVIDSSDLAYFAGRSGKNCNSQKAGDEDYAMDVRNLGDSNIQALMQQWNVTNTDVIANWDAMGLSYDRTLAANLIAGRSIPPPVGVQQSTWGQTKILYR